MRPADGKGLIALVEPRLILAWTLIALMAASFAAILFYATRTSRALRRSRQRHERMRGRRRADAARGMARAEAR